MFDLKCKREGCEFNKNCCCSAKEITVGKNAECKSYKPSADYQKQEKSKLKQQALRSSTVVNCHACGCIFNSDLKCVANGISVATSCDCPECQTIKVK